MVKNTGHSAQDEFEAIHARMGKLAYLHRLVDAAEVVGRTGKRGFTRPAPADYILVVGGSTEFAEVKSTHDPTALRFSLLKKSQTAAAPQVIAAGGIYVVYVKNMNTGEWFRVPYQVIQASTKASIPWKDLTPFRWS